MEMVCKRFPCVNQKILKNLDNQSLTRSKETSQVISKFVKNERFYWIRVIKKFKNSKNPGRKLSRIFQVILQKNLHLLFVVFLKLLIWKTLLHSTLQLMREVSSFVNISSESQKTKIHEEIW